MEGPQDWWRQGEALVARHSHDSAEFGRGLELLRRSAEAGWLEAEVTLGNVYAQVHLLADAEQLAVAHYRRAAAQGHPMAQDRLADLHMIGRGVPQSDTEALQWCRRTAEQAYPLAQCNLAYMFAEGIGTGADDRAATDWYLRAAAQGEPRAYFNLGLRYRRGFGTAPNSAQSWAWMALAARARYPGAEAELHGLEAELDPAHLAEARSLAQRIADNFAALRQTLERSPEVQTSAAAYRRVVEEHFAALDIAAFSVDQRAAGTAPSRHVVGERHAIAAAPRIFTVDDFLSPAECAHFLWLASPNLKAAEATKDRLSGEQTAFNGSAAILRGPLCDPVVRNVERRIAAGFELPASHVEPLSVLRYESGHSYAPHVDYFSTERFAYNDRIGDAAGQRVASFLVYLRAPAAGGETHYLEIDRKVTGRDRMALCHFNCDASGTPDPATLHTGTPVITGEKWLARTTVREKPFY
ncbi:MAG TPA: 2OG-Fe(II) oxygenase [Gammaproteobacteria bacterium]|nr:2OG-Fe(II) oxygenase [Gammaproteobacteria bacterium]